MDADKFYELLKNTKEEELESTIETLKEYIDIKNNSNNTPLFRAIINEHEKIALALIKKGANVNTISAYENTPLLLSTRVEYDAITIALIEKDADLNYKDNNNKTPVDYINGWSDQDKKKRVLDFIESRKPKPFETKSTKYIIPLTKILAKFDYKILHIGQIQFRRLLNRNVFYEYDPTHKIYELDILKCIEGIEFNDSDDQKYLKIILDEYIKL